MKATNYRLWELEASSYPAEGSSADQIHNILRYGVLAPSVHNTQPWVFSDLGNNEYSVSPLIDRALPASDPQKRGMFIGLGCCIMNVMVAGNAFGWHVEPTFIQNSSDSLTVKLAFTKQKAGHSDLQKLFPALTRRQSHKLAFRSEAVPGDVAQELSSVRYGAAHIAYTQNPETIQQAASLQYDSTISFVTNRPFASEVSGWMRASNTRQFDGMPGFTFGMPTLPSIMVKGLTRLTPKSVKIVAKKDYSTLRQAPGFGVLVTDNDDLRSWVEAGLVYEHASLLMTLSGVLFAPKAAIIEAGNGEKIMGIMNDAGKPQLCFGLGYGDGVVRHTPRREPQLTSKEARN